MTFVNEYMSDRGCRPVCTTKITFACALAYLGDSTASLYAQQEICA